MDRAPVAVGIVVPDQAAAAAELPVAAHPARAAVQDPADPETAVDQVVLPAVADPVVPGPVVPAPAMAVPADPARAATNNKIRISYWDELAFTSSFLVSI